MVDVAARLPMAIICEMMAIARSDWDSMFKWANMVIGGEDPEYQVGGSAMQTSMEGGMQLFMHCLNLAKNRRDDNPGRDLLSVIGTAKLDGVLLNDMEIGHNAVMFVLGGLETTRNAISGGVLELMRNPDQWKRLAQNPRPDADRDRGNPALDQPDHPHHAHGDARLRMARQKNPRRRLDRDLESLRQS